MVLSVDATLDHPLLKGATEGVLRAALGKLDTVLQAPGVQLLVGAAGGPVKVVAVGVLESHLRLEVVPSPADAISMAYHQQKRKGTKKRALRPWGIKTKRLWPAAIKKQWQAPCGLA